MKKISSSWFSIIFALGMIVFVSFISLYLLSLIIPYSKSIKGIEFSTYAYYNAQSGLESALFETMSGAKNKVYGYESSNALIGNQDSGFTIDAQTNSIPESGKGNSDFDTDWNRISMNEPIQLFVGGNNLWNTGAIGITRLQFRVPDTTQWTWTRPTLAGNTGSGVILWQISSASKSLSSADNTFITYGDVNGILNITNLWSKNGELSDGSGSIQTFNSFYSTECNGATEKCALKFSIIGKLKASNGSELPFLEYKIGTSNTIPARYSSIEASGNYNGYTKNLWVKVPQLTTNSAFDFTVFQ